MNREELAKAIAKKAKIGTKTADRIIGAFGEAITEALKKKDRVIYSNFGAFYTVHYPSKVILHPTLGEKKKMIMPPTDVVKWMPSGNIKELVSGTAKLEHITSFGSAKRLYESQDPETRIAKSHEVDDQPTLKKSAPEDETYDIPIKVKSPNSVQNHQSVFGDAEEVNPDEEVAIPIHLMRKKPSDIIPIPDLDEEPDHNSEDNISDEEGDLVAVSKSTPAFIDLQNYIIPHQILALMPELFARHFKIVPIGGDEHELIVAMTDPDDKETIELVRRLTGKKISVHLTDEVGLQSIYEQYQSLNNREQTVWEHAFDNEMISNKTSKTAPIIRIAASLVKNAIRDHATEIHVEPQGSEIQIRFRIEGILKKNSAFPKEIGLTLVKVLKDLSGLKGNAEGLPQDGQLRFRLGNEEFDFLTHSIPTAEGEKLYLKMISKLPKLYSLEDLGLEEADYQLIQQNLRKTTGLVLIIGSKNSGKTSTVYSFLRSLLANVINISTIEDPIEAKIPGINQSQVNTSIGFDLRLGLDTIIKQSPDVLYISSLTDKKIAEQALLVSQDCLVITTLEAATVPEALTKMINWGIDPLLLESCLNLITLEHLVRRNCESCKKEMTPSDLEVKSIRDEVAKMSSRDQSFIHKMRLHFFKSEGCSECGKSGYRGRFAAFEIIEPTHEFIEMALNHKSPGLFCDYYRTHNLKSLRQDALLKALTGYTSLAEVWKIPE
ncbi:MAG: ATPase, T2SS/T4P/T4SS family [Candidatus Berkelbacteria bacterium]|nr:ATPase, T2SS/T4P/T4SS family [Candidatus Berkelbacteria bacterium]